MENNFQIDSASVSDRGLSKKRPQNEDSFLEMNKCGLFAVADGVGGAQAGDVASQMAVEILSEAFVNFNENGDVEELMKVAIEHANKSIYQMSHDLEQLSTMATTVVALHVAGNIATIGHVGDSRLYRLDPQGNLYRETQDHSIVEEEVRAGRMTAIQAATHPSRNVISRALGADYTVEIDMKTIMFEPHTTFLLCSDGITRHIDDFELRTLLLSSDKPANITAKMKEVCYQRGAEDNLTAVIVKLTAAPGSIREKNLAPIADYEESTIAAARPPLTNQNETLADPFFDEEAAEIPTRHLEMPVAETVPPREVFIPTELTNPEIESKPDSLSFPAEKAAVPAAAARIDVPVAVQNNYAREEKDFFPAQVNQKSVLGRILTPLLTLLLGTLIGAGVYHLWAQNNVAPEIPPMPPPQSLNIPLTSFEEARRAVDKNPQQYLASSNVPPDTAEDLYLTGRAYLLTGKFPEAKQMFTQAKDRLAQTSEVNSKVLADDIEMGLIMVTVPFAQEQFKKVMNLDNSNTAAESNSLRNPSNR